jgi:hypothetical protein
MHSSDRQQRFSLRNGIALAVLLMVFAAPPAMALLSGIGGVPPRPASREADLQRRTSDLPTPTAIHGWNG